MSDDRIFTDSIHAGQEPDPATGSRAPPIYQTTSYVFDDDEHAAELFALDADPAAYAAAYAGKNIYSRIQNPTTMTLENRLATLEGGIGAITTASGMAALDLVVFLLAEAGDNIVSSSALYGGTYTYLTHTVARRGVSTTFVDTLEYEAYEEAIDEETAFLHVETIGNPALVTPDLVSLSVGLEAVDAIIADLDPTGSSSGRVRPLQQGDLDPGAGTHRRRGEPFLVTYGSQNERVNGTSTGTTSSRPSHIRTIIRSLDVGGRSR